MKGKSLKDVSEFCAIIERKLREYLLSSDEKDPESFKKRITTEYVNNKPEL